MPKEMKALAVDANILISLFLGKKLKQLIIDNLENLKNIEIYVAESVFSEVKNFMSRHIENLSSLSQFLDTVASWGDTFTYLESITTIVDNSDLELMKEEALARIGHRDPKDWPTLALALKLGCPVWTDDKDFFGVGVPVWSSQTIGHYLKISYQDRTE